MNQISKTALRNIPIEDIEDILSNIKQKQPSPDKSSQENLIRRDIKAIMIQLLRKYKIDIENTLSLGKILDTIEEKSDDLYDLGLASEMKQILQISKYHIFSNLYEYILNTSQQSEKEVIINYIRALDNSAIIQIVDKTGIVRYVNDLYRQISGDQRSLVGRKVSAMGGKKYHNNNFWKSIWETVTKGEIWQGIIQNPKMNIADESYYTFTTITPIKDKSGDILEYIAVKFDITDIHKLKDELQLSNERFEKILNSTNQGFWSIDKTFHIIDVNESFCCMLGYQKQELIGRHIYDFMDKTNQAMFQQASLLNPPNRSYNMELRKKDGTTLPVLLKASSLFKENGDFEEAIAFITDISEMHDYQKKLYEASIKDPLTGLRNRRHFDMKLEKYFNETQSKTGNIKNISMGILDIDFFKRINDSFGHDVGDIVLKAFSQRLLHITKNNVEVFRVGGEEFTILGCNIGPEEFYQILENFRIYCQTHPILYKKGEISITISGGMSGYDGNQSHIKIAPSLYKECDIALYAAKTRGRNNISRN